MGINGVINDGFSSNFGLKQKFFEGANFKYHTKEVLVLEDNFKAAVLEDFKNLQKKYQVDYISFDQFGSGKTISFQNEADWRKAIWDRRLYQDGKFGSIHELHNLRGNDAKFILFSTADHTEAAEVRREFFGEKFGMSLSLFNDKTFTWEVLCMTFSDVNFDRLNRANVRELVHDALDILDKHRGFYVAFAAEGNLNNLDEFTKKLKSNAFDYKDLVTHVDLKKFLEEQKTKNHG